jgi:hypothetical protein
MSVRWLGTECRPKWLRLRRDTPAGKEPVFMLRAQGAEEPACRGVRAFIVAQATPGNLERGPLRPARRRVTTAGAKERRKMDAR